MQQLKKLQILSKCPVEEVYQTVQEHFFSNVLSIDEQLQETKKWKANHL